MSERDLQRFLDKVSQLQSLVQSLEADDQRRRALADCSDHNAVVALAQSWGFEIGRRWGEPDLMASTSDNLLREPMPCSGEETERTLLRGGDTWWLTLIQSNAASTPQGRWLHQDHFEWVLLLRGSASLTCLEPEEQIDLSVGDHYLVHPHRRHRVERTDAGAGTLWLALHWTA